MRLLKSPFYIEYSPYSLLAKSSLNSLSSQLKRTGALLKVRFSDELVGYADCHPWEELGDISLKDQLACLAQKKTTPLTSSSLYFAQIDAEARAVQKNLFTGFSPPVSHFLISDLAACSHSFLDAAINEGQSCLKIKLGRDHVAEAKILNALFSRRNLPLRFDFNEALTKAKFEEFLSLITDEVKANIDFIEDPFPFQGGLWEEVQDNFKVRLACDRQAAAAINQPKSASTLILKPAIQCCLSVDNDEQRLIVTSYLDHPLGQLAAAYTACQFDKNVKRLHGLNSHYIYEMNQYSQLLAEKGALFKFPEGTGFGFDDLLEGEPWQKL